MLKNQWGRNFQGVVAIVDDCKLGVNEFELQLRYNVHVRIHTLWKGMNTVPLPQLWVKIVPLLFFQKDGFGFK